MALPILKKRKERGKEASNNVSQFLHLSSPVSNVHAWPAEDDKEVHAVDTNAWVVPGKGG